MPNKIDMIGKRFGRLVVIEEMGRDKHRNILYRCKCDCGGEVITTGMSLRANDVKSCGCIQRERWKDLSGQKFGKLLVIKLDHIEPKYVHGKKRGNEYYYLCKCECNNTCIVSKTSLINNKDKMSCGCNKYRVNKGHHLVLTSNRIYGIYNGMKDRCFNKNCSSYYRYGGRGITVCDDWLGENGFINFYKWSMEHGYEDTLSIDRIDNDSHYCPENCRWTTFKEQQKNKSTNHMITFNGETLCLQEWADRTGQTSSGIRGRLKRGWTIEETLTVPVGEKRTNRSDIEYFEYKGERHTINQWARILSFAPGTLRKRMRRGMSFIEAIETPLRSAQLFEYNKEWKTLKEWAEEANLPYMVVVNRVSHHQWSLERALTTPYKLNSTNR